MSVENVDCKYELENAKLKLEGKIVILKTIEISKIVF